MLAVTALAPELAGASDAATEELLPSHLRVLSSVQISPVRVMTSYSDAGVDIDAGNLTVRLLAEAVSSTATPAVLSEIGAFGGLFAADDLGPGKVLVASTDGVGTKVELAARYQRFKGLGVDLVNHCVNDILVQGARPLFFLDYIATASLVPETVLEIVTGMSEACKAVGCALLGGETAEIARRLYAWGDRYRGHNRRGRRSRCLWPRTEQLNAGDLLVGLPATALTPTAIR